jgi:hypothetical protein
MKRRIVYIAIVLCAGAVAMATLLGKAVAAKRKAPPPVKSVVIANVEYRVPNTIEAEGLIEAWSTSTQKLLWKKKIYSTLKLPPLLMETDVQYNFITNMTAGPARNELTIVNEKGRRYTVDTVSRKIRRQK